MLSHVYSAGRSQSLNDNVNFFHIAKKTPDNVAPLTGTWVTESGTYIDITQNADGSLTGKYYSLGVDGNAAESEVIHGQAGDGKPTTFGMVVAFKVNYIDCLSFILSHVTAFLKAEKLVKIVAKQAANHAEIKDMVLMEELCLQTLALSDVLLLNLC